MTTIHGAFINALLSDSSYIPGLADGQTGFALNSADLQQRLTPALAQFISDNFTVISHQESDDVGDSGFDGTVWRGNAGTPYEGEVYVSMQGTTGLADFLSDGDLSLFGAAREQIAEHGQLVAEDNNAGRGYGDADRILG